MNDELQVKNTELFKYVSMKIYESPKLLIINVYVSSLYLGKCL